MDRLAAKLGGAVLGLVGAIVPWVVVPVAVADLNQQLTIRLNNGTRGSVRDRADQLLQQGKTLELDGLLTDAIQSWRQALQMYQDIGDREAAAQTYSYLATAYTKLEQYPAAEDSLRRRLALVRDRQDYQGQIYALNSLGRALVPQGGFQAAADLFTEAIEISSRIRSLRGQAISHDSLGVLASIQGNYPLAKQEFERSLQASRRAADSVTEATTLNNLGDVYRSQARYSDSLKYYALAGKLADINLDRPNQYRAIDGMVVALNNLKLYNQSVELLAQRLDIAQDQENLRQELRSLEALAQVHQQAGDLPKARQLYERAIGVAQTLKDTNQETLLIERMVSLTRDAPKD